MKKLISFSLAVGMLLSATACGREEYSVEDSIDDLIETAEDIIDPGFSGIIASGRKYCYGEDANDYRKEIQDEEDFDDEWLMIVENGEISFFYAEDFDEEADSDERIPKKYRGMTLEEIFDAYVEEQEGETPTEEVTTVPVTTAAETTTIPETTTTPAAEFPDGAEPVGELKLQSGGSTQFTLVSANTELADIFDSWIDIAGIDESKVNYYSLDTFGAEAAEMIEQMILSGADVDAYVVEPDWTHRYIDNPNYAAPMSSLGFTSEHFSGAYPYTIELGTSVNGEFVAPSPVVSPGAFAYNADLAQEYLGVYSPEEMQEAIGDWDKFQEAAKTISDITGGKVALADSLNGFMFAYDQGRTSPWVVDGKMNIDGFCREMADTAKNLWDIGGVSKSTQWSDEWTDNGAKQKTMGYFVADWSVGGFLLNSAGEDTYGSWSICQGPQAFYWGGYSIAVNPATDNGDLAQSFIYYTCIDDDSMSYNARFLNQYVNNTDVMAQNIERGYIDVSDEVSGNLSGQNYLLEFHKNALAINNTGITTPYDEYMRYAFTSSVCDVYLKGGSFEETASEAIELAEYYINW